MFLPSFIVSFDRPRQNIFLFPYPASHLKQNRPSLLLSEKQPERIRHTPYIIIAR
jgi:hypothetical protein